MGNITLDVAGLINESTIFAVVIISKYFPFLYLSFQITEFKNGIYFYSKNKFNLL